MPATRSGSATCRSASSKIGNVLVAQGDLPGALAAYRTGLAIMETLAARDAGNMGWQRDLSVSHEKIGDVLVAQGDLPGALSGVSRQASRSRRRWRRAMPATRTGSATCRSVSDASLIF